MHHSLSRFVSILFILGMLLAGMPVEGAHAAGILVNTAADEDVDNVNCSLREAINAANSDAAYNGCTAGSGTDTITFAGDYTITLSAVYGQLPPVTSVIIINGNGPDHTIIEASSCNPITIPYGCTPATYRVFSSTGGNLTLDGMTVRHGQCAGSCTTSGSNGGGTPESGEHLDGVRREPGWQHSGSRRRLVHRQWNLNIDRRDLERKQRKLRRRDL